MPARRLLVLAVAFAALGAAGCTSASSAPTAAPAPPTVTTSTTITRAEPASEAPLAVGPTTSASATACPLAPQKFVQDTIGLRLGRVTVQRSGGKAVGCRIYAVQGGALHASEHLPGPSQPVVEITTARYATPTAAHNAFVRAGSAGRGAEQARLGGTTGVCFQTEFYPKDNGRDWACAVNKGTVEVTVRTVDTTGSLNTVTLLTKVLAAV